MALPFWHALTGRDTVSHFAGRGKKTAWATRAMFPGVTEAFVRLSSWYSYNSELVHWMMLICVESIYLPKSSVRLTDALQQRMR